MTELKEVASGCYAVVITRRGQAGYELWLSAEHLPKTLGGAL